MRYITKLAETEDEYLGLRRLNHRVFALEVGQHEPTHDEVLPDRYEQKSRYLISLHCGAVIGMLAIQDQPPFSIEQRLEDISLLERLRGRKLEVRLLAIDPEHRNRMVMAELLGTMIELAIAEGYEVLLISGIEERLSMYRKFGFEAVGPPVPSGKARYVPMLLSLSEMPARIREDIERWRRRTGSGA